ncbi:MAG: DNA-binding protein [Flavobacteriia bacterium]|nr:DNA-binding protein [Flavobacteriia bacterium]
MENEIIIYQADSHSERIEVTLENETVWLSLNQIATVFDRDKSVISKHLKNIFKEEELIKNSVVAFFAITASDGKTYQVEHYNLDAILSVGYRVNSKRGTQFRKWASQRLTDYLLKGYAINNRMNRFENQLEGLSNQVNQIEVQIKTKDLPVQGIFMDGQVFDAYELSSRIIRCAQQCITLVDNYIDERTFTQLAKKQAHVRVIIRTQVEPHRNNALSKQLALDLAKANEQYGNFEVKTLPKSHDRFLIIDDTEVYHLGASLKDLGKRLFAFTKLHTETANNLLTAL